MNKIVLFLAALSAFGQPPPAATSGAGPALALVRFHVEQKGKPVTDLRPEDIEIRVDGKPQKVVFFQGGSVYPRDIPIEVSLLFDCDRNTLASGALSPQLFTEALLDEFPNLSIAVYGFTGGLTRLAALTRNQEVLNNAVGSPMFVHPVGTFLLDHISRLELETLSTGHVAIRMLVIFSERQPDKASTTSAAERERHQRAVSIAQRTGIGVYPILLRAPLAVQNIEPDPPPARTDNVPGPRFTPPDLSHEWRAEGDFISLGAASGGKKLETLSGGNMLPTVLAWIADQLRYEYVAGFEISQSGEMERHKVKVVMRSKSRGKIDGDTHTLVY